MFDFEKLMPEKDLTLSEAFMAGMGSLALLGMVVGGVQHHMEQDKLNQAEATLVIQKGPSVIFGTVAQCVKAGYPVKSCKESWDNASHFAEAYGTRITENNEASCKDYYGYCYRSGGGGFHAGRGTRAKWVPSPVGWEALKNDLSKSIPVYRTNSPYHAMRPNGQTVSIDFN